MKKLLFNRLIIIFFIMLIGSLPVILPAPSLAGDATAEVRISKSIYPGLRHLLDLVDPEKNVAFDPGLISTVMDFIESPKDKNTLYFADDLLDVPSAYHEFDNQTNLRKISDYAFNPDIPCIATMPSSTRLFQWLNEKGERREAPRVEQYLVKLESPVVETALQYVEITPDTNSGAYYGYNVYQALIVFKYRQRRVLITVSTQTDVSSVGKKGYVLGADEDWDYFYSGKKGLTLPALGWVSSYMYGSSAINVYYEIDEGSSRVRIALFKWLRAGWSGINMVQRKHIYNGLKRFAKPFKQIMEYPTLPPADSLAVDFARIRRFSDDTLRSKMDIYADILENRYNGDSRNGKKVAKLLADKEHWSTMSRDEMEAALVIEYMKAVVGKTPADEIEKLLEFKTVQQ